MCKQNELDQTIYKEMLKTCKLIITQHYFQHTNTQYLQEQYLAMGAPTSSVLSEIYLQYLENTKIFDIMRDYRLLGYFRCVDDILIAYKDSLTNIHEIIRLFNKFPKH